MSKNVGAKIIQYGMDAKCKGKCDNFTLSNSHRFMEQWDNRPNRTFRSYSIDQDLEHVYYVQHAIYSLPALIYTKTAKNC